MALTARLRRQKLYRRWIGATAVFSAPFLFACAVLVSSGSLAPGYGFGAALLAVLGVATLLYRHFSHIAELQDYIQAVGAMPPGVDALPKAPESRGGALLATGLRDVLVLASEERQRRRRELQEALDGNESILASLPEPLLLLDDERRVVRMNPAAKDLLGQRLLGRNVSTLLRDPLLAEAIERANEEGGEQVVPFVLRGKVEQHMTARVARLSRPSIENATSVLTLNDVTSLKRAEQLRADFVANASHELRTPLSSLIGFLETLRGPAADDAEARDRFLAIMHQQALRMSRLVSDLMSLSRIEMEEHRPPTERLRLDESLRSVVNGLEIKAAARKIVLDCRFDLPMTVTGEEDEIAQVFQNLVDNAIKYGKEGSRVTIEASLQEEGTTRRGRRLDRPMTVVSVSDEGEGIAREHIPRLTERFYRIDPARSRELGGTGLGLAIVKHLVNRHRGILEIESEVGRGSRFTVYLPQAQATSATQSPAESKASSAA